MIKIKTKLNLFNVFIDNQKVLNRSYRLYFEKYRKKMESIYINAKFKTYLLIFNIGNVIIIRIFHFCLL